MARKYHRKDWAMYYVLLSGGSGKRLWPLSNDARPKQYLKLVNREINSMDRCSMLQRVWEQMEYAGIQDNTIITTEKEQIELIKSQVKNASIAVEPMRRDTFGAVLLSCSYLHSYMGAALDDYAVIMPVDPYTEANYFETAKKMEHMMRQSGAEIGLMGAVPSFPSTKYGYIIPGQKQSGYYDVQSFEEKPDEKPEEKPEGSSIKRTFAWGDFGIGIAKDIIEDFISIGYNAETGEFEVAFDMKAVAVKFARNPITNDYTAYIHAGLDLNKTLFKKKKKAKGVEEVEIGVGGAKVTSVLFLKGTLNTKNLTTSSVEYGATAGAQLSAAAGAGETVSWNLLTGVKKDTAYTIFNGVKDVLETETQSYTGLLELLDFSKWFKD